MPRPSRWNEIVQAAAEEFREQGFEAATLEAVAGRLGMLKGSLYNYIDTKDDLLFAVIQEPAEQLLSSLRDLQQRRDESSTVRLLQLFHDQVKIFSDHYPAAFVYLQQLGRPSQPSAFREMDAAYIAAIEEIITDGISAGEFSSALRPAVATRALVGILDWMHHWFVPRGESEDRAVADELFSIAVGGLSTGGLVLSTMCSEDARSRQVRVDGQRPQGVEPPEQVSSSTTAGSDGDGVGKQ